MTTKAKQLPLALPHRQALAREDFLVTASNSAAVELIDQWPNWPSYGAVILGPAGSGKSHLSEVWRKKSGAELSNFASITIEIVPELLRKQALVLEVMPNVNERALFHVLNAAKQQAASILITAQTGPHAWNIVLPDLQSRLNALPSVSILPPDDELLRGVLLKLCDDRQIPLDEATLNFMLLRMPRSLQAASALVAAIDHQALVEKAEITRPFVARVLGDLSNPDLFDDENQSFT
jgi:chromosomal replication initiation ATPase DnaA